MLEKIMETMENGDYTYYGIRVDVDVDYSVGDYTSDSRIWIDGESTEEMLNGTSCVGLRYADETDVTKAIKIAENYAGNRIYLIGSDSMEYGEDEGEYILENAVVVAILK